jgi:branched-subunit amino acid permease
VESDQNRGSPVARWLSRLSFSFLIVAMIVGWDVRREYVVTHTVTQRMAADIALVAVCVVLAIVGTALRHRQRNDSDGFQN